MTVAAATRPVRLLVTRLDRAAEALAGAPAAGDGVLLVGRWRSLTFVGPYWRSGLTGCPVCLATRVASGPHGPAGGNPGPVAPATRRVVEELVRARRVAVAAGDERPAVQVIQDRTGAVESHPLLADSGCAWCAHPRPASGLPAFTPADRPLAKLGPGSLRTRPLAATVVLPDYLHAASGLFQEVREDLQSPFGACSVQQPAFGGGREPAIGRAAGYRDARRIAVLEGLERLSGLHQGGRRAVVRAAWTDAADRAVDPRRLGLSPAVCRAAEGFAYRPFDPDTPLDWVTGYSYARGGPVLVPERSVFWGPRPDGETGFAFETSNGCALGSSAEEAVLHGLRELVERDSFLLTWYRKLRLPEVSLAGTSARLDALLARAELFTGARIRAFMSTMEYGMPSFWLTAECSEAHGPAVVAGAGAHPSPAQAVEGGLLELVGAVLYLRHHWDSRRAAAERMLDDPWAVRTMTDHALVNALPAARDRFAFLLDRDPRTTLDREPATTLDREPATTVGGEPVMTLADVPGTLREDRADLRADLATALDGMATAGLEVIAVDQTRPELARAGLHCVRVVVPGLLPMTFGHRNRRTDGLPRLRSTSLPYPSGRAAEAIDDAPPHPFP